MSVTMFGNPVAPKYQRRARFLLRRNMRKYRHDPEARYPLKAVPNGVIGPRLGVQELLAQEAGERPVFEESVVVGTIRMGYGHYRIAMAIASAAKALGYQPYWFDLLSFDATAGKLIHDLDYWYSVGSRLSQRSKTFNRFVWDPLMGSAYKRLEKNYPMVEMCRLFANVYGDLPRDVPFVGTHPWLAHAGVHAGLSRIVNVIPDNCPLGFHLSEGAFHTVQSPSAYTILRTMRDMGSIGATAVGIPADQIGMAGHYIDHEQVVNLDQDCARRLERMSASAPRRLLISIGGAGAQQALLIDVVKHLLPSIRDQRVALLLNFGDHADALEKFQSEIPEFKALAQRHTDWTESSAFADAANEGPVEGLHAFLHNDTFAAVYLTNLLMRCSDVLLTKPSELAFYPIPKLLLQRVGGHEAWGAIRSAELGEGTVECTSATFTLKMLDLLVQEDDLLTMYCENIRKQYRLGVYDGAYAAVKAAVGNGAACKEVGRGILNLH